MQQALTAEVPSLDPSRKVRLNDGVDLAEGTSAPTSSEISHASSSHPRFSSSASALATSSFKHQHTDREKDAHTDEDNRQRHTLIERESHTEREGREEGAHE